MFRELCNSGAQDISRLRTTARAAMGRNQGRASGVRPAEIDPGPASERSAGEADHAAIEDACVVHGLAVHIQA